MECILLNGACLKTWSTTQSVVVRSSGEAECYAAVKGAAEGMTLQLKLGDLGLNVTVEVHTDSRGCRRICNRRGLEKLRHVEVVLLWLQQHVQSRMVIIRRIAGSVIPADQFTKYLAHARSPKHDWGVVRCVADPLKSIWNMLKSGHQAEEECEL